MSKIKILALVFLGNPMCTNWIHGLKTLGYQVVILDWKESTATKSQLENWGFTREYFPIFTVKRKSNEISRDTCQEIQDILGGVPDMIFNWEGARILKPLKKLSQQFPNAKVIHCINSYPNAANMITEMRINWWYRSVGQLIDGYIFYSATQRRMFSKFVPLSRTKPYIALLDPFFKNAFADGVTDTHIPQLERLDGNPHVIFTGRSSELWDRKSWKDRKNALGPFFEKLASYGVHIFLPSNAQTRAIPNFHLYPSFSNKDLFEGVFSQYISQFDAHLVFYNEPNNTMRRWTSSSLSTRFAYALTSVSPVAVRSNNIFVKEYFEDRPFGFMFKNIEDLADSLYNKKMLETLRRNMKNVHLSYSFESKSKIIEDFFNNIFMLPRGL